MCQEINQINPQRPNLIVIQFDVRVHSLETLYYSYLQFYRLWVLLFVVVI